MMTRGEEETVTEHGREGMVQRSETILGKVVSQLMEGDPTDVESSNPGARRLKTEHGRAGTILEEVVLPLMERDPTGADSPNLGAYQLMTEHGGEVCCCHA